ERDIIARVGFPIYKSEDELDRQRSEAAATVAPIFEYRPGAADTMLARVGDFFASVDSVVARAASEREARTALRSLLRANDIAVSEPVVGLLLDARSRARIVQGVVDAIRVELPAGVAETGDVA